jgi:uncharacterized membrane protein (DUF373 family)
MFTLALEPAFEPNLCGRRMRVSSEPVSPIPPTWNPVLEKFEKIVVVALMVLLALIVAIILLVIAYLFARNTGVVVTSVESVSELPPAALRAFSGVLLVLLGLELLDTVKVYFREHSVRVEVILLVGLIAMGRHVLEIDLYHIDPMTLFGFAGLILALSVSYFLVKRAQVLAWHSSGNDARESLEP